MSLWLLSGWNERSCGLVGAVGQAQTPHAKDVTTGYLIGGFLMVQPSFIYPYPSTVFVAEMQHHDTVPNGSWFAG